MLNSVGTDSFLDPERTRLDGQLSQNEGHHSLLTFLQGIIAGSVQLFYAWRIAALTKKRWISCFITICAFFNTRKSYSTICRFL